MITGINGEKGFVGHVENQGVVFIFLIMLQGALLDKMVTMVCDRPVEEKALDES